MGKLPRISPLTLRRVHQPFDHADWLFELKHDGFRGVAYIRAGQCRLMSRDHNVFKSFKALSETLGQMPVKNAILDGDIVALDGNGTSIFNQLLFRRGVPYFYAFDLLWVDGHDLRGLPLVSRKDRLKELLLRAGNPALLYADHIKQYGVDFFRMICEKDLEGIVAKHGAANIRLRRGG